MNKLRVRKVRETDPENVKDLAQFYPWVVESDRFLYLYKNWEDAIRKVVQEIDNE